MGQVASMTGFARSAGADGGPSWFWEVRSLNARGLEARLKVPPSYDSTEPALRLALGKRFNRGTVQASLTVRRGEGSKVTVDGPSLARFVEEVRAQIGPAEGRSRPRVELLMMVPGVVRRDDGEQALPSETRLAAILADFDVALDVLAMTRSTEGVRLAAVIGALLDRISDLQKAAAAHAAGQPETQRARLTELLNRLVEGKHAVPADRVAQEVALLAARSDASEELDRLASHIRAAQDLIGTGAPIGRQLDFLVQEFMREANTLCSKAATSALTVTGLQLQAVVEQLREQVQNIE